MMGSAMSAPLAVATRALRLPRALPEPAVIGICAPSGRVDEPLLKAGVAYLEDLGHRVVVAEETLQTWRYFAGTDEERVAGFHRLVDDPSIDMVLAARGGYGFSRLLPHIDWNRVADDAPLKRDIGRNFMDEQRGPITSWAEFEKYPWPDPTKPGCTRELEWYQRHLPEDMCVVSHTAHFAEHLRKLEQARLPVEALDARQGAVALDEFLHLIMLVANGGQLREVGHTKDLVHAGEVPELLSHGHADAPTDALVDLVEDQGRDLVGAGEPRTSELIRPSKLRLPESTAATTSRSRSISSEIARGSGPELPMQVVQP